MLRLENIIKDYKVADTYVHALKGIDLAFRSNEFVSILGPSGCGKTTMLNIIGGLDKYTSGDLFINGRSTKNFKDRDWDVYRNHRIGFIFQSYNLIPHQTILGNVELALTIAGLSKEERVARAKKAIDRVGLEGQYNKKPNQLSGGQCQRVAIARALVNEPEILLADEPTGALDTQTSVQIMDLIKEISKEKLVIMVTHNPDLAKQYSTRIVRLLDGQLISDSNPYSLEEERAEVSNVTEVTQESDSETPTEVMPVQNKKEKAKMSFWTAFKLSLRNLFTKKARTALICVAGSIGIIGVSSVLAVSSGVQGYITSMQDDMLSGNPVQISETAYDLSAMMTGMSTMDKVNSLKIEDGKVNVNEVIKRLITQGQAMEKMQISNNITQDYIDYVYSIDAGYAAAISLEYGIDVTNNIYTDFQVDYYKPEDKKNTSLSAIKNIYTSVLRETDFSKYASYVTGLTNVFQQAP
ncbi:MAG: ABC transporter ATP-binding protein, partial [Anaeroplasmataceae bacterium]|nr:ABC transporter ATP-binding protein [Anaeroplasmataceae bacterium]